jgi:transposase
MNLSQKLREVSLDKKQWQILYYKNQQEYIRKRLSAIRYLSEGKSRAEVGKILRCRDATLAKWIEKYLAGGLAELVKPISHQVKTRLTPEQQQELKRKSGEKIMFFDKFAVTNRPSTYYGWAEKNTKPQVPSNEQKKREKLNGLLAVDAISGEEFISLVPTAKTEDIALYLGELCRECGEHPIFLNAVKV